MSPTPPIPGQPHPDVAIVKHVLQEITPGDVLPYEEAAKALQLTADDPVFKRRATAARKQLERPEHGSIVIVCVPGQGFLRELPIQTKERVAGRETRALQRKARRNVQQLISIDPAKVPESERPELYGLLTVNRAVQVVTAKPARAKLTAACTAISAELATAKALEVLQERSRKNGGSEK